MLPRHVWLWVNGDHFRTTNSSEWKLESIILCLLTWEKATVNQHYRVLRRGLQRITRVSFTFSKRHFQPQWNAAQVSEHWQSFFLTSAHHPGEDVNISETFWGTQKCMNCAIHLPSHTDRHSFSFAFSLLETWHKKYKMYETIVLNRNLQTPSSSGLVYIRSGSPSSKSLQLQPDDHYR